ncbi:MFS transporter [Ilumatobacter sp.]|uniref:MFS transporter n=1 Tax=Ilumatobacter sp. TaxID=1967498 RepID=UPI003B525AF2
MTVDAAAPPRRALERRAWTVVALATMCSALPAFLTGALGVQLRDEVGLSATDIGLAMGTSFAVAAVLSAPMGRVAQRLGPRRAFRGGLAVSTLSMALVAAFARDAWQLAAALGLAGGANALNQPSANLLLATHVGDARMGFALATKQSGMPAAALLGGVAVPAIALTLGWEWAFVVGAVLAVLAGVLLPADVAPPRRREAQAELVGGGPERAEPGRGAATAGSTAAAGRAGRSRRAARPDLGTGLLVLYAVVGLLGSANAGAMVGFITSAAEASGLGPGAAGLVLSLGSLLGVASRMFQGWQVDHHGILPIQRLVWLFGLGGLGVLVMAIDAPITYVLAPIPAFAFGWAWPGLFNLSVIRNNPSAPAAATGISQVGVFAGAALGPAVGGVVIDDGGYRLLWLLGAATLLVGSMLAVLLRTRIRASRVATAPALL